MNDLIELKLVSEVEAECLYRLQIEAFMPLYEKYQDDDTSPAKESFQRVKEKIIEENSDFYFIIFNGKNIGGIRVKWYYGNVVHKNIKWISPIFIIPEYQNKGIASKVIEKIFAIYPNTIEWKLDTIKQEKGNCHLYEKCGFIRCGDDIVVNEKMTLVMYVKNCINIRRFKEQDELYKRATRIEIPASITATEFYRKSGYDYKNGDKELDEEEHYRLEKFKEVELDDNKCI